MIEELSKVLSGFISPERKSVLLNALNVLYENNQHAVDFELQNIIATGEETGYDQMILDAETVIRRGLHTTLREFGVEYDEGASTSLITSILAGINLLEEYLDHDMIISRAEDDGDTSDILCDLLSIVTDRSWGEYSGVIYEVPAPFMERLAEVHQKAIEVEESELDEVVDEAQEDAYETMIKERLKKYLKGIEGQTQIERLIADGFRLGSKYTYYIDNAREELEALQPKNAKRACQEMLAMALATCIKTNDIKRHVNDQLENVYFDMSFITEVDIALTDEIRKVQVNG